MHPLTFLLILFASTVTALPATPASPTTPPTTLPTSPPPPRPFLPTPSATGADPTPSPIYSTLGPFPVPSNSSSNASLPCASIRRPLRLGPARLHHKKPSGDDVEVTRTAAAGVAAAAVETSPADGPRDYASLIPPAPGVTPRPEPNLAELGYYQTTYYSCATRGVSVHCGWHRPVMVAPANNAAVSGASGRRTSGVVVGMLFAGIVGVFLVM